MSVKEPNFSWGGDLIQWRLNYITDWLTQNHPSLHCEHRKRNDGGYDIWICLNKNYSEDEWLMDIQLPTLMKQSSDILGNATVMRGLHHYTAPVLCRKIEKTIMRTGNYNALMFLDAMMIRTGRCKHENKCAEIFEHA